MTVQLSVLKIIGYGPWTLTLGSDREHELQILQASLYAEIQRLFSERNCLVFSNRADEMFALSTGLGLAEHAAIQDEIISKFANIRLRIAIGRGPTPAAADRSARESVSGLADPEKKANRENNPNILDARRHIYGAGFDYDDHTTQNNNNNRNNNNNNTIMHMDIDGLSERRASPYETSLLMFNLYQKMSLYFYEKCESLKLFMGGDNFMIISSETAKDAAHDFIDMIIKQDNIQLNCGVGSAKTGRDAARLATESLDMIRSMRDSVINNDGNNSNDTRNDLNNNNNNNLSYTSDNTTNVWPRVYEHATGQRL